MSKGQIYRCGRCEQDWPYTETYKKCAECGRICSRISIDFAMMPDAGEAASRVAHLRFERFLVDRERGKFDEIIEAGGFQEYERESILALEKELKSKEAA